MLKKISLLFFFLINSLFYLASPSYSVEIQSPRFKIDMDRIDIDSEKELEPAIYTIQSLYGSSGFKEFNSQGYLITHPESDLPLQVSLSNSLINFTALTSKQKIEELIAVSTSIREDKEFNISLIQEYPFKNFSGDTVDLDYSYQDEDLFRPLPNQNKGGLPVIIIGENQVSNPTMLAFRLNSNPNTTEGTYETILNFIATPND